MLGRDGQTMLLAVGRPSADWIAWLDGLLTEAGADHALVVTLEVGWYWPRQEGWRGTKVVELGATHRAGLPWLTSLESPVGVLQLTGALVGRDGRAVRIGAEGLLARPTGVRVGALGARELVGEEEIARLRSERREDLPGQPLVWEAALDALVEGLLPTS